MYVPGHFRESDMAALHAVMREHDFALLIAKGKNGIEAAHLPFLLDSEKGERGTLLAHMARANPLWRTFAAGEDVLIVFQGPHAYISPNWYAAGGSVPTWNYVAVHAYGVPRVIDDPEETRRLLDWLVDTQERGRPRPWKTTDEPGLVERMVPGIVAFEIPIARIEGKWKLSQNKTRADRESVIATLERSADPLAKAVAAAMTERERD